MITRGRQAKMDILRIAMEATSLSATSSGSSGSDEDGGASGGDAASSAELAALSPTDIEALDAASLRRLLLATGLPASGRVCKLRERLLEARGGGGSS
jgi:hypothetical protein